MRDGAHYSQKLIGDFALRRKQLLPNLSQHDDLDRQLLGLQRPAVPEPDFPTGYRGPAVHLL
jgi:hypothetical protein